MMQLAFMTLAFLLLLWLELELVKSNSLVAFSLKLMTALIALMLLQAVLLST